MFVYRFLLRGLNQCGCQSWPPLYQEVNTSTSHRLKFHIKLLFVSLLNIVICFMKNTLTFKVFNFYESTFNCLVRIYQVFLSRIY